MARLEKYVDAQAAALPSDMVVYQYTGDSLSNWINRFPITNDNINDNVVFNLPQRYGMRRVPPLSEVTDSLSFRNFGRKWYLVRMKYDQETNRKTVYGLEIMDSWGRGETNGVNPNLHLADRFTIVPAPSIEGVQVSVQGRPQFNVLYSSSGEASAESALLIWISLFLILTAFILLLDLTRSLRSFIVSVGGILLALTLMFFWGRTVVDDLPVFSPLLYAATDFFYSMGAVLIINIAILSVVICLYLARKVLNLGKTLNLALAIAILTYSVFVLRSIILNSDICLELYRLEELSYYTALVYSSFLALLLCVPMLLKISYPGLNSRIGRVAYSVAVGALILLETSVVGFQKEKDDLGIKASRLAVDRNINLELLLKRAEEAIANDQVIASTSQLQDSEVALSNYIIDKYLSRIAQDHDIAVLSTRDWENDLQAQALIEESLSGAVPISDGSRFMYVAAGDGRIRYSGMFIYFNPESGISRVLLGIMAKSNHEEKGYNSILGFAAPGQVVIPSVYSYAKYNGRTLQLSKGSYAYPTSLNDESFRRLFLNVETSFVRGNYVHFVYNIDDEGTVVISRPSFGVFYYIVDGAFIALLMYILISLCLSRNSKRVETGRNYYRRRISWILMLSLSVTLVSLVLVSVLFVYRRNDANKQTMMSDKINAIRSLIEGDLRRMPQGPDGVAVQDVMLVIQNVARASGTDITLYDQSGKLMISTVPEIYSRLLLAGRIDKTAFDNIAGQHKKFFIHKELLGSKTYFSMYAPIYNTLGALQAIICAPYTDNSYDFEKDAVVHSVTIIVMFLILLLIARMISATVVGRLFKPLSEMSLKMASADLDRLEHISYDRDDELSSLVAAYNRMVDDLTDSSRKLAQAERDKAWSGMARQVAHEIKNPLTPMKLQLQRLIRLKDKGDPQWEDKFDEVSRIVLDHIDILSDTANEFSEIAKLPTEEMTEINLDLLISEEICMFSGRETVEIEYMGLEDARVEGPKPQLTRVIVNLLTNAVQALENVEQGRILISVRNSAEHGYYDIVVEDNGPGVPNENLEKLFTPNFTTKTSGSGLGLAISRSILQRCNASISYSRSFTLGGACFTIHYPRK